MQSKQSSLAGGKGCLATNSVGHIFANHLPLGWTPPGMYKARPRAAWWPSQQGRWPPLRQTAWATRAPAHLAWHCHPSLSVPKSSICTSSLRRVPGHGFHPPGCQQPQVHSLQPRRKRPRARTDRQGCPVYSLVSTQECVTGAERGISLRKYLLDKCTHVYTHIYTRAKHMCAQIRNTCINIHVHTHVHGCAYLHICMYAPTQHPRHPTFRSTPTKEEADLCFQL